MTPYHPRVLVIYDEAQIHRFLRAALEAAGFEPLRADSGAEGLREIARAAPDIVVLDLGRLLSPNDAPPGSSPVDRERDRRPGLSSSRCRAATDGSCS